VLHDGATGNLAQNLTLEAEAGNKSIERGSKHVLIPDTAVGASGAREGDSIAAENRDCPYVVHVVPPLARWVMAVTEPVL